VELSRIAQRLEFTGEPKPLQFVDLTGVSLRRDSRTGGSIRIPRRSLCNVT